MRNVLIYSTTGQAGQTIESAATTWGDLQRDLSVKSIAFDGMKAVIGDNKHTLESDEAVLPEGNFTLFLMPKKTKSGATKNPYKDYTNAELKKQIRSLLNGIKDKDALQKAKKFFAKDGRSYNMTTNDHMKRRLLAWDKKYGTAKKAKPAESKVHTTIVATTESPEVAGIREAEGRLASVITAGRLTQEEVNLLTGIRTGLNATTQIICERQLKNAQVNVAGVDLKDEGCRLARQFEDVKNC